MISAGKDVAPVPASSSEGEPTTTGEATPARKAFEAWWQSVGAEKIKEARDLASIKQGDANEEIAWKAFTAAWHQVPAASAGADGPTGDWERDWERRYHELNQVYALDMKRAYARVEAAETALLAASPPSSSGGSRDWTKEIGVLHRIVAAYDDIISKEAQEDLVCVANRLASHSEGSAREGGAVPRYKPEPLRLAFIRGTRGPTVDDFSEIRQESQRVHRLYPPCVGEGR